VAYHRVMSPPSSDRWSFAPIARSDCGRASCYCFPRGRRLGWIPGAGLAMLAAMLIAACAPGSMPAASDRLVEQARSLSPPPEYAGVYVIRRARRLADQPLWTVDLDFRGFGTVGSESYLYGWVRPGEHVVAVLHDGQVQGRTRFRAEAGRNYFFMVGADLLTLHVERLADRTGRDLIQRYTPSGDNRFEDAPEATRSGRAAGRP
jgi:hypothetical protein